MKRLLAGLILGGWLLVAVSPASADSISLSLDVPATYSVKDATLTDAKASGVLVGVSLPFLVGFGYDSFKVTGKIGGTTAFEQKASLLDVFLDLPLPILNIRLGAGVGKATLEAPTGTGSYPKATLTQLFVNLGYPILPLFDVHLGYRVLGGDTVNSSSLTRVDLGAKMVTLGVKVGF